MILHRLSGYRLELDESRVVRGLEFTEYKAVSLCVIHNTNNIT